MNPMPESTPTPIITAAGTGTIWNVVGDNITCKVSGDQTQGAYAVVENRTFNAPQGTVFVVPKSVPHSLRNISAATSRVLVTLIPGGFEKFFAQANDITDPAKVMEIAKHHDVEFLPPKT